MVWTDHVVIPSLNATPGQRLYADGPRIAVFTAAPDSEDGFISVSDLRRDDLRALVADSSQVRAIAEKKLWFGMLQGSLEHEGLAELVAAAGGNPALVETTSSGLSSQGIVVLAPGISPPASTHAESVARLSTTLAAGNLVAAPRAGLDAGGAWWEIAAETGDTRAVVETGLNGGRGGFRPPNPIRTRVTPQTNSYAGPRVYEIDPETLSSIRRDAGRTSGRAQSVVRSQRGGGKEYSALVILVGLASFAAKVWVGYIVAVSVYSVTEQIVALLTSA
jgi:hypothetical protein